MLPILPGLTWRILGVTLSDTLGNEFHGNYCSYPLLSPLIWHCLTLSIINQKNLNIIHDSLISARAKPYSSFHVWLRHSTRSTPARPVWAERDPPLGWSVIFVTQACWINCLGLTWMLWTTLPFFRLVQTNSCILNGRWWGRRTTATLRIYWVL